MGDDEHLDEVMGMLQLVMGTVQNISLDTGFDKIMWPMLVSIDGLTSDPERHPFWVFDWKLLMGPQVLVCTFVLMFAGILCSAGGIGGGGIYVTVLMVAGSLKPYDAVPLSKAIVFFGSMSSLVLNLRKTFQNTDVNQPSLIDYNICRLVVPSALIGTLVGVLLNRHTSDWVIVSVLSTILLGMTWMTGRAACAQYTEEQGKLAQASSDEKKPELDEKPVTSHKQEVNDSNTDETTPLVYAEATAKHIEAAPPVAANIDRCVVDLDTLKGKTSKRNTLTQPDMFLSLGVLLVVVVSGVLRFHAGSCEKAVKFSMGGAPVAGRLSTWTTCHHPTMRIIGDTLESVMSGASGHWVLSGALAVPLIACLVVMVYYGRSIVINEAWTALEVCKYEVMAVSTGCLAGLVGIGGGLIFAPFFLLMGVEPSVAVATSSTCVIFTSSSTTLQYLLTDRIAVSLTVVYGIVNLVASFLGTSFVHFLQDNYGARKSYITGIVGVGVAISAVLSVVKLASDEVGAH